MRSPGRREIGHGALAERALLPVVPTEEEFPYTIRLVTEILSSNGSTSMASVCGSSLAMMDAGVPIKGQVAGIAMGLITGEGGKVAVLSDIQGVEDNLGDMDFKVAGTAAGVTAMQMDMKIKGIGVDVLANAIQQAKEGRMFIMNKMNEALREPRQAMSRFAPRMITVQIHPDKIREVIGPGGKMIRKIIEDSGVASIDIEDDGRVIIGSVNEESASKAEQIIRDLTGEVEVGKNYRGKVVRIMPFGAFVQIMPNQDGLVHISQLAEDRVEKVEDAVNVGDDIEVKVTEVDRQGRVNLSRKAVLQEAKGITNGDWVVTERDRGGPPRGGSGGFNRGGGDRGPRREFDRGGRGRKPLSTWKSSMPRPRVAAILAAVWISQTWPPLPGISTTAVAVRWASAGLTRCRGWDPRRPHHGGWGGARPERGPAGRAFRGRGRQAARPAAPGHRPFARRRVHHQHPEVPATQ